MSAAMHDSVPGRLFSSRYCAHIALLAVHFAGGFVALVHVLEWYMTKSELGPVQ